MEIINYFSSKENEYDEKHYKPKFEMIIMVSVEIF